MSLRSLIGRVGDLSKLVPGAESIFRFDLHIVQEID